MLFTCLPEAISTTIRLLVGASLTYSCLPSVAMPRGRWPPGRVPTTMSVAVSITDMEADFSFGT